MATPVVRAIEADGRSWDDPSAERLHDLLADMNLTYRFVIVERVDRQPAGQHYMQVYLNDDFSYLVEYRDGSADQHFRARVDRQPEMIGVDPVAHIVRDWAFDRPGWREALPWAWWSPASYRGN